jgi:DNA invertase Pin-like site-specific DNA recombinase
MTGLLWLGMAGGGGRRPLSKSELEHRVKLERTKAEIAKLVAEYHLQLSRAKAKAIGAAYARYSTKHQDSVVDQIRAMFVDAVRKGVFIPLENIFFDLGVSGTKSRREGLTALKDCLDRKAATVVFFFSTNRLHRNLYRSLQFVVEEVVGRGIRAVFTKSGIDTADGKRWKMFLNWHAVMDESVIGMNADSIRESNAGLLNRGMVYSTLRLGYKGVVVPGEITRRNTPREEIAIDPPAAEWVRRIYTWYVVDRVPRAEIARRLNADPAAPKLKQSSMWRLPSLTRLLANCKYRGLWKYGENETVLQPKKDTVRKVPRSEPLAVKQLEHLRIVPDDTWFKAQALIAEEDTRAAGRKPEDGDTASRPRLLGGLFYCPVHDRPLQVAGKHGKYQRCPDCLATDPVTRTLFSQLNRAVALQRTCETLAEKLREDRSLVDAVVAECQATAALLQAPDPAELARLEALAASLKRKIDFQLENPGDTDEDQQEARVRLRQLRDERARATADLEAAKAARDRAVNVPTVAVVRVLVDRMAELLVMAATGPRPEEAAEVRVVIDLLTGGRIDLEQVGERRLHGGYLRGRFRLRLVQTLADRALGLDPTIGDGVGEEVTIDYDKDRKKIGPAVRARVVDLYHQGMLKCQIAEAVGVERSSVRKIVVEWHKAQGLPVPNAYDRLKQSAVKRRKPTMAALLADEAYARIAAGRTVAHVAKELNVHAHTVTLAWRHWFSVRGLEVVSVKRWRSDRKQGRSTPDKGPGVDGRDQPPEQAA